MKYVRTAGFLIDLRRLPAEHRKLFVLAVHALLRPAAVPAYLNRLADMLFVAARYANHTAGITDSVWSGQASR